MGWIGRPMCSNEHFNESTRVRHRTTYFYHPFRLPKNMAEKLLRKSWSDNFSVLAYGL
jgi:hypothetical protein